MPKKLSKQEVEKIAKLARLELTDKEIEMFSEQLSDILAYIGQLQEVDTKNVQATSQVTGLANVLREDEIAGFSDTEELVKMAPENEDNLIKVKSVFE